MSCSSRDTRRRKAKPLPELWSSLDDAERFTLLLNLVAKRRRSLVGFDNVISVGLGYRTRGESAKARSRQSTLQRGQTNRQVSDEVCLRFIVSRKTARPKKPVPKPYRTFVTWKGKRRRCIIPTDVDILGKGGIGAGDDWSPDGVVAKVVPGLDASFVPEPTPGALCCRVVDKDNPEHDFLLGCHHVFTMSANTPGCTPLLGAAVYRGHTGDFLGPTVRWTTLMPAGNQAGIDAALAKSVFDEKLPPWVLDEAPRSLGKRILPPRQVRIRTPRGMLAGEFLGLHPQLPLTYPCGVIAIGPVYEFMAATAPGDSGSPVLDGDTLWGMHFYGTDFGTALAFPVFLLFGPKCFKGMTIDLPST